MIGFEDPKPGEYSIVHDEFAGKKLSEVIDIICNGGTKKGLEVKTILSLEHSKYISATLADWPTAQTFRVHQELELDALRDAEVEDVRELFEMVVVYVTMESIKLSLRR